MSVVINGTSGIDTIEPTIVPAALNATGSAPLYAARAWVNFDGTGTVAIRASGNVSSITDNGTGIYTVNFTDAMSDANYAVMQCGTDSAAGSGPAVRALHVVQGTRATSSVQVTMQFATATTAGYFDYEENHVAIFR